MKKAVTVNINCDESDENSSWTRRRQLPMTQLAGDQQPNRGSRSCTAPPDKVAVSPPLSQPSELSPANLLGPGPRHSLATTKASKVSGLLLCSPEPPIYHAFH